MADPDVADDLAVLDRDQAGPDVPGGHHVVPEVGHLLAVVAAAVAERGRHHPPYVGGVGGQRARTASGFPQLSCVSNCSTPPSQEANGSGELPPSP